MLPVAARSVIASDLHLAGCYDAVRSLVAVDLDPRAYLYRAAVDGRALGKRYCDELGVGFDCEGGPGDGRDLARELHVLRGGLWGRLWRGGGCGGGRARFDGRRL